MNENQLDIFSGPTQAMNEAYDCLKKCDFSGASERFREVLDMDADNKEAQEGLEAAGYWQLVFRQLQIAEGKDRESLLYRRISDYTFTGAYGHQLLRKALTGKLIEGMEHENRFFLPEGLCIVDLHLELNQHAEAENALQIRLQSNPGDVDSRCRLANLQWTQGKRSEAKQNYVFMLYCACGEEFLEKIEYAELRKAVNGKGVAPAAAYGWLQGLLPLVDPDTLPLDKCKTINEKGVEICRTLYLAEKYQREKNTTEKTIQRKKLHALAPRFYKAYFQHLSAIKELKFTLS